MLHYSISMFSAARDGCCRARHSIAHKGVDLQIAAVVAHRQVPAVEVRQLGARLDGNVIIMRKLKLILYQMELTCKD